MTDKDGPKKLWAGRFREATDRFVARFTASVHFDQRLAYHDIQGSVANATMLQQVGILSEEELAKILSGLQSIQDSIDSGEFIWSADLEDVHMNIEAALTEKIGSAGKKLHTGRSRNDQVATDIRLYLRDEIDLIANEITVLQKALLSLAKREVNTIMPGFTHLQTAQPVTFGHHLMAYVEMFSRDRSRFLDCQDRMNESPLGAAALAGTGFPIDRQKTAADLGFKAPMANSLDAVSARDFAVEAVSACSICAMHLSRLAEEIVIWASAQFHFVRLSDAWSTGSSIMPQKRNPDAAELVRAKTGRIYGALQALLTVLKGLPLAYSKDMQEDKELTFLAFDALDLCLASMTGMVSSWTVDKPAMRAAAAHGFSTATDLADYLVRELGLPFREAHHVTGATVKLAEDKGCDLAELSIDDLKSIEPRLTDAVYSVLTVEASVNSRQSYGGTSPVRVREQVSRWKELLS